MDGTEHNIYTWFYGIGFVQAKMFQCMTTWNRKAVTPDIPSRSYMREDEADMRNYVKYPGIVHTWENAQIALQMTQIK